MMDDEFVNSFADEDIDEPTTYTPPPVSAEEEAELDEIIRTEIMPVIVRYQLAHRGNLAFSISVDSRDFYRLPFFAMTEEAYAATHQWLCHPVTANQKRLAVRTWQAVAEAKLMAPWRELSYAVIEAITKAGYKDWPDWWMLGDWQAICSPRHERAIDIVVDLAEQFKTSHAITDVPIARKDIDSIDALIAANAPKGENLKLSLARLADAAQRMGFPALTAISAAIVYNRNPELKQEMK